MVPLLLRWGKEVSWQPIEHILAVKQQQATNVVVRK
jgi:hypothetical protein